MGATVDSEIKMQRNEEVLRILALHFWGLSDLVSYIEKSLNQILRREKSVLRKRFNFLRHSYFDKKYLRKKQRQPINLSESLDQIFVTKSLAELKVLSASTDNRG